jgi:hypothetical protein
MLITVVYIVGIVVSVNSVKDLVIDFKTSYLVPSDSAVGVFLDKQE